MYEMVDVFVQGYMPEILMYTSASGHIVHCSEFM